MQNDNKKSILTFIGYYLPGYKSGGPVRTISNMVNLLHEHYDFKVITLDRDLLENKPYENVNSNRWNDYPYHKVYYINQTTRLAEVINKTEFDMYYLNSFFDYHFSIKVLLLLKAGRIPVKPVLLAPRGELMKGALSVKWLKKRVFIIIARLSGIYKNITWHASSEYEAEEIKREMGNGFINRGAIKVNIAMDVPDYNLKIVERTRVKKAGELKILYLSSITPKKNLLYAINILNEVRGNFIFDIYGPVKDKRYWKKCLSAVDEKIKDKVSYKGIIRNDQLHTVYPEYDLFFFPTLGENFGHVIFEALSYGTPVLCSSSTPWDKLQEFNAGWNFSVYDLENFVNKITELIEFDESQYTKHIKGCDDYCGYIKNISIKKENNRLFLNSLH